MSYVTVTHVVIIHDPAHYAALGKLAPAPGFGKKYGLPMLSRQHGLVFMFRKRQACRWYDMRGTQVGPEQIHVGAATVYAIGEGWVFPDPKHAVRVRREARA